MANPPYPKGAASTRGQRAGQTFWELRKSNSAVDPDVDSESDSPLQVSDVGLVKVNGTAPTVQGNASVAVRDSQTGSKLTLGSLGGGQPALTWLDEVNSRVQMIFTGAAAGSASMTVLDRAVVKRGASGQTANLLELQDDTGAVLAKGDKNGNLFAPTVTPSGLTGGTAAVRVAGGTATTSPASGTWVTGDLVIAQNGHVFVCTAGGTPGTWVEAGTGTFAKLASNLSDLASLASARLNLGLGVIDDDTGATVATTAAKTTLMAGAHSIAGNTFAVGDVLRGTFSSTTSNTSGGTLTVTHEITFAGTVLMTAVAISVATGTLAHAVTHQFEIEITAIGASGTGVARVWKKSNTDNAQTLVAGDERMNLSNLTGLNTTGALTMDHKVTHSSASAALTTIGLHSALVLERRAF